MRVVVVVHGQTNLLEMVLALGSASRFPCLLDSREQQGNEDRDNRDHHNNSINVNPRRRMRAAFKKDTTKATNKRDLPKGRHET